MPIIDSQVHAYGANTPDRPWYGTPNWPEEVTGEQMVAAMDEVGVDGAILVSAFIVYQYDAGYAVDVRNAYPGHFALVKPIDTKDPAAGELVADWKNTPGTVAIRLMLIPEADFNPADPGYETILRAAKRHDFPVNLLAWGNLDAATALVDRYNDVQFVIDHLGLKQPFDPPAPPDPFGELPKVLDLAKRDNAVIKVSGACTLSHAGYPYDDIWDPLARVFDAWGIERCLWGTDWTRAHAVLSYEQGVEPFRLTDRITEAERETLMGGACARVYGWAPGNAS